MGKMQTKIERKTFIIAATKLACEWSNILTPQFQSLWLQIITITFLIFVRPLLVSACHTLLTNPESEMAHDEELYGDNVEITDGLFIYL